MRGFGGLGNLGQMGGLMKQAQKMMEQMQQELESQVVEGSAGGGMVVAQVSGTGKLLGIKIDRECVDPDDVEMLQDLVLTAVREASDRAQELRDERQRQFLGGMGVPKHLMGG